MAGQIPAMNQGQQQQGQQQNQSQPNQGTAQSGTYDANDADLCQDALTTEKYISSTYNTTIFEFNDPQIRRRKPRIDRIIPGNWGKIGSGWLARSLGTGDASFQATRQYSPVPLAAFARCQ